MNWRLIGAILSLIGWILLLFVAALPSGWIHLLLVAAVLLIAVDIPMRDRA